MNSSTAKHNGYTLVELSVVLVIISLLTAGGLSLGVGMVNQAAHVDTSKILNQIEQSLHDYYTVNGNLPCPAAQNLAIDHADFGREVNGGACNTTGAISGTSYNNNVRIGMVPVRTLGLSDRAASDKYGNRILYAVTRQLTDSSIFGANDGAVQVMPASGGAILTDAAYFLWSAGKDHKGAPLYSTAAISTTCSGAALDAENCDNDNVFRDAPFNNGDVTATFFDDQTRWAPKFHLAAMSSSSDTLWAASGDANLFSVGTDGQTSNTNVGIGTDTPASRLQVSGSITADDIHLYPQNPSPASVSYYVHFRDAASPSAKRSWVLYSRNSNGAFTLRPTEDDGSWKASSTIALGIDPTDGSVGIGTDSPTEKLDVNGTAQATAFKGNGAQLTSLGACVARDTTFSTWASCPSGMSWVIGFSGGTSIAMPAANYWHTTTAWICCK